MPHNHLAFCVVLSQPLLALQLLWSKDRLPLGAWFHGVAVPLPLGPSKRRRVCDPPAPHLSQKIQQNSASLNSSVTCNRRWCNVVVNGPVAEGGVWILRSKKPNQDADTHNAWAIVREGFLNSSKHGHHHTHVHMSNQINPHLTQPPLSFVSFPVSFPRRPVTGGGSNIRCTWDPPVFKSPPWRRFSAGGGLKHGGADLNTGGA